MKKQQIEISVDDTDLATVEILAPEIARVVDSGLSLKVSENDLLRLSCDPSTGESRPKMAEILYKQNPVLTEVEFWTTFNCRRMIALAATLGAEVVDIDDINQDADRFSGTIRIAHPENIDILAIARAAGVCDIPPSYMDEDNEEGGAGSDKVMGFDEYFKKPIFIPYFSLEDGEVRPFRGFCRSRRPMSDENKWEEVIGIFTAEGKYFSVYIDTIGGCALPQFFIDDEPFYLPIIAFEAMGDCVDPETGELKPPANLPQQSGLQDPATVEPNSAEAGTTGAKPNSSSEQ